MISESEGDVTRYLFARLFLSMVLLWLSFPPVGWSLLAWFALLPMIDVIVSDRNLFRSEYIKIWSAGFLYWLATFYFIPIPHPALWLGWIVISAYLACYLPAIVFSSQVLKASLRIPWLFAIPVSWVGYELIRNYLFTGMGLVCLSHTQFRQPVLLQICDLFGGYTLTFCMVLVSTSLYLMFSEFRQGAKKTATLYTVLCAAVLCGVLIYGRQQLGDQDVSDRDTVNIGLIQGSMDTDLLSSSEQYMDFLVRKTEQYLDLNHSALRKWQDVDLIVWPENGWPVPDLHPKADKTQMSDEDIRRYENGFLDAYRSLLAPGRKIPSYLVGALTYEPVKRDSYGSILFITDEGDVDARYYKNHLVMFGEYVPLANWFPLLNRIPAVGKGLVAGKESVAIDLNGFVICPSICFESTVPHYIRSQLNGLADQGSEVDVMVNVTNDGWFYGTSCLDFHLACNVLRAVEMRKPHLVCANTGLSAHIDERGNILQEGPRRATATILAKISKPVGGSLYRTMGDTIPIAFACVAILGLLIGVVGAKSASRSRAIE